jgi:hypothetical protein
MAYSKNGPNNSNTTGLLLTPRQISMLPASERAARMGAMTPAEQQLVAMEAKNMKQEANQKFLRKSLERIAYCPAAGSGANTQPFTAGTTLTYNFPTVGGAYVRGLLIRWSINLTFAAGTGAAYTLSASAPFSIFSEIDVLVNSKQVYTHPNIIPVLDALAGYAKYPQLNGVLAGLPAIAAMNTVEGVAPQTAIGTPQTQFFNGAVTGTTTWAGQFYLPLNAYSPVATPGILPAHGVGNIPQVKLVCNNQLLGNDPYNNPIWASAGTAGWAVTVNQGASTFVAVDAIFSDGSTMDDPNGLAIDIAGEPTLQYNIDNQLNPLTANTLVRQHINTLLEHAYVVSWIIDGQTNGKFSTQSNISALQLSADSIGKENFFSYNVANNIPVSDFFDRQMRRVHGQDLPEGIIVWVDAPSRGIPDPDNRNGSQTLNMKPGGYPATTHAYQVAAVGAATPVDGNPKATPRVETILVSLNDEGLKLVTA